MQKLSKWFYFCFWIRFHTFFFRLSLGLYCMEPASLALLFSITILQVILHWVVFGFRHSLKYSLTSSSSAFVHFIRVDEEVFFLRSDASSSSSSCRSASSTNFSIWPKLDFFFQQETCWPTNTPIQENSYSIALAHLFFLWWLIYFWSWPHAPCRRHCCWCEIKRLKDQD